MKNLINYSLLQGDCELKKCYVCGTTYNLHKHHIYEGRNRKNSEKYGCWVYLCPTHHNMSDEGVHFNKKLDNELKYKCQVQFELTFKRIKFLDIFRRNYV